MSGRVHIYSANYQPATRYVDHCGELEITFERSPKSLLPCRKCGKRRRAENLVVQVYYDQVAIWCAPLKGCNDPKFLAKRARRTKLRRSVGQKMRWKRLREAATRQKEVPA